VEMMEFCENRKSILPIVSFIQYSKLVFPRHSTLIPSLDTRPSFHYRQSALDPIPDRALLS